MNITTYLKVIASLVVMVAAMPVPEAGQETTKDEPCNVRALDPQW